MTSFRAGRFMWSAGLLAIGLPSGAAAAQNVQYPAGAVVQPLESGASTRLANHVRTLAALPKNLTALLGAGNAALELGDTQAALTFFARAEEVAPRDGRVKAGMGSAFVHNMQPQAALKFFADAAAAGAPLSLYAKDRGLAYDMIGDPARAQADYATALQYGRDPEVERRMALSKAISGDKAGALALLGPQLQRQDRAGWRANAFVLALSGDLDGAVNAVRTAMPSQTVAIRPFLAQLPQLSAADKAMAVHFGHFPQGARFAASTAPAQAPVATAGQPDTRQPAPGGTARQPVRMAEASRSRRPSNFEVAGRGGFSQTRRSAAPTRSPSQAAPSTPAAVPGTSANASPYAAQATTQQPVQINPPVQAITQQPVQINPPAQAITQQPVQISPPAQAIASTPLEPSIAAAGTPIATPAEQAPALTPAETGGASASAGGLDFADVAAVVQALPDLPGAAAAAERAPAPAEPAPKSVKAEPKKTKPTPAKTAEKKAEPAKPKEPARIWVQLAAAQNKAGFPAEFKRLTGKAPKLLSGKTAWTAPYRATNRLLVGPFKTEKEARSLVNELSKADISSFSWTSDAGQAIEKLSSK